MASGLMDTLLSKSEALKGIRVLDITRGVFGPWAATLLAELGAEVIHIEPPGSGDPQMRSVAPFGIFPRNISPGMMCANANKFFAAIDLSRPEGSDLIRRLATVSDIVLEDLDPGLFDSWGIGYRQLSEARPEIIYVSLRTFGNWGELSDRRGSDAAVQAISGLSAISGFKDGLPLKTSSWVADFLGGTVAAFYLLAALYYRKKSGKGQFLDLSQAEILIRSMDWTWLYGFLEGKSREPFGNRDVAIVPACIAKAADGYVALAGFNEEEFEGLCTAMGAKDLLEFREIDKRFSNADKIYLAIEQWAVDKKVGDIAYLAERYGFASARVLNAEEIYKSAHFNGRNGVWRFDDPLWGDLAYPFALHLDTSPGRIRWSVRPVGFDNAYVLDKVLGLSPEEVERLFKEGIVGKWDEGLPFTSPPPNWDGKRGLGSNE